MEVTCKEKRRAKDRSANRIMWKSLETGGAKPHQAAKPLPMSATNSPTPRPAAAAAIPPAKLPWRLAVSPRRLFRKKRTLFAKRGYLVGNPEGSSILECHESRFRRQAPPRFAGL